MSKRDSEAANLRQQGLSYAQIAERMGISESAARGTASRGKRAVILQDTVTNPQLDDLQRDLKQALAEIALLRNQLNEQEDERLYGHDLGKPWRLDGDWVIAGDVHVNTTNWNFAQRPLQVAMKYLDKPRRIIIAGDMVNGDAFSKYENSISLPSFGTELKAARHFIDKYLEVFDEIYLFLGNHDRRIQKGTNNAIDPENLLRLISHDTRVKISQWGHCVINSPKGEWRILHGSEYSVNQLVVADQLAQKYGQHIIGHHQHHHSLGWSRFKQHVIIDNGGLFDENSMAYVQLDDNKRPRMVNGFTMLLNGSPYLFGKEPLTDYDFWLGNSAEKQLRKAG
jgi:transcriptional regulator with XRE-family HTH domain/predicted phosphodiesterase